MGVKSTITIWRQDALREVMARLMTATNDQLSNVLEEILGDQARFYNFTVTDEQPDGQGQNVYSSRMFYLE